MVDMESDIHESVYIEAPAMLYRSISTNVVFSTCENISTFIAHSFNLCNDCEASLESHCRWLFS